MRAAEPNTLRTALVSAVAPSNTNSTPPVVSRPRSTRSASSAVTSVVFSVSPSYSPTGTFLPSRPRDRHPPRAECHRTRRAAVLDRVPVRVVLAFRPGQPGDLGLHHRVHHLQAGSHAHREQPLAGRHGGLAQGQPHLLVQIGQLRRAVLRHDAQSRYLAHGGPLLDRAASRLPDTYHPAGTRRGTAAQVLQDLGQPPTGCSR